MNAARFFERLAAQPGHVVAIDAGPLACLDYATLCRSVARLADELRGRRVRVLVTQLDNGAAWVVADLAALLADVVYVPLPSFFTRAQCEHARRATGADAQLRPAHADDNFAAMSAISVAGSALVLETLVAPPMALPAGTAKITFTSGTTGQPKGVCLSAAAMLTVAEGLAQALAPLAIARHLCALPLPVLLENIAGLYAPLLAGATAIVLPGAQVGLIGSSRFDPASLQRAVDAAQAHSVIVLPQMLRLWAGWRALAHRTTLAEPLKLVAVGGAHVGAAALAQARAAGLPAYEGYGLSEGASVQALNLPGRDRPGSVGRPLPHARLRVNADGELEIGGALMLGYVGEPPNEAANEPVDTPRAWWPTGDLGHIDADGFVHVSGRRKNVLITGYGRNVSPEWVEAALQAQPAIAHAVVGGDGEDALWAVLWPSSLAAVSAGSMDAALAAAVKRANADLPDYAHVGAWLQATLPFTADSGLATANGRPQRAAVLAHAQQLRAQRSAASAAPTFPGVRRAPFDLDTTSSRQP